MIAYLQMLQTVHVCCAVFKLHREAKILKKTPTLAQITFFLTFSSAFEHLCCEQITTGFLILSFIWPKENIFS